MVLATDLVHVVPIFLLDDTVLGVDAGVII